MKIFLDASTAIPEANNKLLCFHFSLEQHAPTELTSTLFLLAPSELTTISFYIDLFSVF
jgi:hypothetical protein